MPHDREVLPVEELGLQRRHVGQDQDDGQDQHDTDAVVVAHHEPNGRSDEGSS